MNEKWSQYPSGHYVLSDEDPLARGTQNRNLSQYPSGHYVLSDTEVSEMFNIPAGTGLNTLPGIMCFLTHQESG